jgi:molybdopterin synthase catalytic subunit
MTPSIHLTHEPIRLDHFLIDPTPEDGAQAFFSGHVRGFENGRKIRALVYEAYESMARKELERLVLEIHGLYPVSQVRIVHRLGTIPIQEAAIALRVTAPHRKEAFEFLRVFMDRLKQDVPIWKIKSLP